VAGRCWSAAVKSMSPLCSDGHFPRINDLARAGIDLESAASSGSMRQLLGPIPATASTGKWGEGTERKGAIGVYFNGRRRLVVGGLIASWNTPAGRRLWQRGGGQKIKSDARGRPYLWAADAPRQKIFSTTEAWGSAQGVSAC
jgi:hypothetical protein